jgi:cAMP-specific phosphodiesterase 4
LEALNGIPQTPYLKGLENRKTMATGEIGFLTVIVKPLWETINRFTRGTFAHQIENMEETIKEWKRIAEE